jgi:Ca-activated chloride channel family protein
MKSKLLLFIGLLLLAINGLYAQNGTLKGVIKYPDGTVVPFVNVVLLRNDTTVVCTALSDDKGYYTMYNILAGTYSLQVLLPGGKKQIMSGIKFAGSGLQFVDFTIQKTVLNIVEVKYNAPVFKADMNYNNAQQKHVLNIVEESVFIANMDYDNAQNEEYGSIYENRFIRVQREPLSTFSLDVDAASYSNMRRMINQGIFPPKDAVRIEELINYFRYNYPQPVGTAPVHIETEVAACPWASQHQLLKIGVKAKEIATENLPPSNFVFLIDVSGSMEGAMRLDLVKASLKLLTNNLRKQDRVAIVVYAGAAGQVLASTPGNERQKIVDAIDNLSAGGSTAGGAGIQLAYKIAKQYFIQDGNNRVILCTDGDFNVGISSPADLKTLIERERSSGIFLTVLGYGMGNYKDNKLQTLAQKGNGNHAYIDNLQEANRVLVNEFGSTMHAVAQDVKIQVEFNPAYVQSYRLIGYESRLLNSEDFNDDKKDAGDLGAGHTVTALYELVPVGTTEPELNIDTLKYQIEVEDTLYNNAQYSDELLTVKLRYKLPGQTKSEKMEIPVPKTSNQQQASDDFQFIMAVAMFGQLLRESEYKGTSTFEQVILLSEPAAKQDTEGYRQEFVRLVNTVKQMKKN